ncbi:MAG TPA: Cof-type HAD-IIB family hydrolase [Tetragenococcus sp.]|nr:Cof-type HAD-IIB family hydrolase [Tetragenococcus sp.]
MSFKAIAMDLDGTLLNSQKKISPATKKALLTLQKKGIKLILASGRPTPGLMDYARELSLDKFGGVILSFNGAHVLNVQTKQTLFAQTLAPEKVQQILTHLQQFKVKTMICHKEYMYVEDVFDNQIEVNQKKRNIIEYEARAGHYKLCEVDELARFCDFPLYKILTAASPVYLKSHYQAMREPFKDEVSALFSDPFYFEFTARGVTKGYGLNQLLPQLGIKKEELLAFGDGENDRTMLEYAGLGVVMGNASEELKQAADQVTLTNDQDGIVKVLSQYF